jgi:hypothetical protein
MTAVETTMTTTTEPAALTEPQRRALEHLLHFPNYAVYGGRRTEYQAVHAGVAARLVKMGLVEARVHSIGRLAGKDRLETVYGLTRAGFRAARSLE